MVTERDYDRDIASLEKFVEGKKIAPRLVEIRSDFARSEALRHFFASKAETDFYLEDILNSFIALVQYPLNFAIFSEEDGKLDFKCHFCSDKQHEENFLSDLRGPDGKWIDLGHSDFFQLFPHVLEEQPHYIAIYHMDTKTSGFDRVLPEKSCFPPQGDKKKLAQFDPRKPVIADETTYIASCADHFFQFKWDVFESEFIGFARHYLLSSIRSLAANRKGWSAKSKKLSENLERRAGYSPEGRDAWKAKLSRTFSTVLRDSTNGINLVTSMMIPAFGEAGDAAEREYPPNMLLAFRAFSRSPENPRHVDGTGRGYIYDTSFLISDGISESFLTLLYRLRSEGKAALARSAEEGISFADAFEGENRRRCCYETLTHVGENAGNGSAMRVLDKDFWHMLMREGGPQRALEILSSWVGDNIRSLVDPVYHTGLIHTNHMFQYGGLDRIGGLHDLDVDKFEDIPPELLQDARRVVIMYYVLAELVGWCPDGGQFDPGHLAAILVPIKMRGSVWGVTIHGAYTPNYDKIFADQRYWEAYFKLTTDHRQKNAQIFDRYLWGIAEEKVSNLFLEFLAPEIPSGDVHKGFDEINFALRCEERNSPFAFPQFRVQTFEPVSGENFVCLPNEKEISSFLVWDIVDNVFFTAHQRWDKKATRRFSQVVEHGVMRAIQSLAETVPRVVAEQERG